MTGVRAVRPRVLRCDLCGRPRYGRSELCDDCLDRASTDFPAPTEQKRNGPLIRERDCTICGRVHDSVGEFCPHCDEDLAREIDDWYDQPTTRERQQ